MDRVFEIRETLRTLLSSDIHIYVHVIEDQRKHFSKLQVKDKQFFDKSNRTALDTL